MAKKKKDSVLTGTSSLSDIDALLAPIAQGMADTCGLDFVAGEVSDNMLLCLPVPAMSIRYLLRQEGWPLSRMAVFVGEQSSFKSTLTYEITRWHRVQYGKGYFFDTESKAAPELLHSILNYDRKAFDYISCDSMEAWNRRVNTCVHKLRTLMDGDPKDKTSQAIGRTVPVAITVDSLLGALDQAEYDHITDDGTARRHFATQAGMLNDYLRVLTKLPRHYPISVMVTAHLKLKPSPANPSIMLRHWPGGQAPKFHMATEIEMVRKTTRNPGVQKRPQRFHKGKLVEYATVQMSTMKNSCAPNETIMVDIVWYTDKDQYEIVPTYDNNTGDWFDRKVYKQTTYFDWHSASIWILEDILRANNSHSKDLKSFLGMDFSGSNRCWCPAIGISEKDKLSFEEAGAVLEEYIQKDTAFAEQLYPLLNIRQRTLFRPMVDMRDQIAEANERRLAIKPEPNIVGVVDAQPS